MSVARFIASQDLRLVGEAEDSDGGKLIGAAQRIAAIHQATREITYADEHGQLTIRPGALQLVFCDVSTPAGDGWNGTVALLDDGSRLTGSCAAERVQIASSSSSKAAAMRR
jgi:hypothetical protein